MASNAKGYTNDASVENMWAMQAFDHCETYMNLLSSVDSRLLKLSDKDDVILRDFRKDFPNFDINIIKEDTLKSPSAKMKWRAFCNHYKKEVEDFNKGLLLRLDCTKDYSEENTIFVTKIQFLAIEIARNTEGLNLIFWKAKRKEPKEDEIAKKEENDNAKSSDDKNS